MKKQLQVLFVIIVAIFLCMSCAATVGPHGASVVIDPAPTYQPGAPPPASGPPPQSTGPHSYPAYQAAPDIPHGHMPHPESAAYGIKAVHLDSSLRQVIVMIWNGVFLLGHG